MASFDIKTYYAEQDERMNVPDETVEDILKRVSSLRRGKGTSAHGSSRKSPARSSIETDDPQSGSAGTPTGRPGASSERNVIFMNESVALGRTMKRRGSVLESDVVVAKRRKSVDHDYSPQNAGDHALSGLSMEPRAAAPPGLVSDAKLASPERSAEIEDIDSFTVDMACPEMTTKRETPPRKAAPSSHKHKQIKSISVPQQSPVAADHSPISSFSRVIADSPRKSTRENLVPVSRQPPLNLRPIRERLLTRPSSKKKETKAEPDPYEAHDSPIEDASLDAASPVTPSKKKRLEAEPSKMFLEIKQLMAKHGSNNKKQADKIVKRKAKPVLQQPSGTTTAAHPVVDDSSIIYISSSPSSRANSLGPTKTDMAKQESNVKEKPAKSAPAKRMPKGKKEKPQPMTPAEYARMIQADTDEKANVAGSSTAPPVAPKLKRVKFPYLTGKHIFYAGGDMRHASEATRRKMDIIVKNGGDLMPEYDPAVTTHIVTDAHRQPLLRVLGLKSLTQIPHNIPTVKWTWVRSALALPNNLSQGEVDTALGEPFMHAAYHERIDAGCAPRIERPFKFKSKERTAESSPSAGTPGADSEHSHQPAEPVADNQPGPSTPPEAPLSPPTSPLRPIGPSRGRCSTNDNVAKEASADAHDPLAEFYHEAKLQSQTEDRWKTMGPDGEQSDASDSEDEDEGFVNSGEPVPRGKRGWTCDTKEPQQLGDCPNEDIITKLNELMQLHKAKPGEEDRWRTFSYGKSIRALKNYPRRIRSFAEARSIRGVGLKTAQKIQEILQTGELQRIKYEKSEDVLVTRLFQGIYGVGQATAFQWYAAGCRTLQDLRRGTGGVKLSAVQKIGLIFYDDINDRMPRAEAKAIFDLITPIALSIDPKLSIEIMGSYRRGKADCGDIDILMTRPTDDGKTHSGVLSRLLNQLHDAGILVEDLAIPDDLHDLEATYRGLCRLPHVDTSRRRRIDILCVPWTCRGSARLYYTGDDIFNRAIRMKANVLGYSLNQRGLFGSVVRNPSDRRVKTNSGEEYTMWQLRVLVASETEEEIFKILGVPWQEPHERVRG
ncbi:hypothetical protein HYPSUDRAFT_183221 [Hypholoma sublateritium FD-334 SS-4]|uniref:DNA-directed DNA polymerase n=1 Tax=Hypholoma sublateritium (strain FD-334 SS-4) TaxID=945553 RepID=A0A0D2P8B9_HYPSF|nr:hypothetical protein HYPSUDRAFT_183221 [Hypholoma sublateritium FD-334 SS-4]